MNFFDRQDSELKQTKWVGGWVIVWLFSAVEEVADWTLENDLFNNWYSRKFAS